MVLKEEEKLKEIYSIKRQFIFEKFNYENKIAWGIMGIGVAISAYLFQHPFLNWFFVLIGFLLFSSIYELFFLLKIKQEIHNLIREIKEEKIIELNPLEDYTKNFILYIWEKGDNKIRKNLRKNLIILLIITGISLCQLLYQSL